MSTDFDGTEQARDVIRRATGWEIRGFDGVSCETFCRAMLFCGGSGGGGRDARVTAKGWADNRSALSITRWRDGCGDE